MTDPEDAARARLSAIEVLQEELSQHISDAQRELFQGLLTRLQQTLDAPATLVVLLAEFQRAVAVPLASAYARSLLALPALQQDYFAALGLTNYKRLLRPLASFLEESYGITVAGDLVPGGWVASLAGDTTAARQVLQYAYQAKASGVGLDAYRAGLERLITGGGMAQGILEELYQEAFDTFQQSDRLLQQLAATELGLSAFLYLGGLIKSSRPFCMARDGKCFTDFEIAKFGTKEDAYGGYSNKAEGEFSGKPMPYNPLADLGGYSCRHGLNVVSNVVALRMRPDLAEDKSGKLYIK